MENNTQTTPAHTPTPWFLDGPFTIDLDFGNQAKGMLIMAKFPHYDDGLPIARVTGPAYCGREDEVDPELLANAEFIVTACNAFDDLYKATRYLKMVCEDRLSMLREEREQLEPSDEEGWYDDIDDRIEHYQLLKSDAEKAIAKANGSAGQDLRKRKGYEPSPA